MECVHAFCVFMSNMYATLFFCISYICVCVCEVVCARSQVVCMSLCCCVRWLCCCVHWLCCCVHWIRRTFYLHCVLIYWFPRSCAMSVANRDRVCKTDRRTPFLQTYSFLYSGRCVSPFSPPHSASKFDIEKPNGHKLNTKSSVIMEANEVGAGLTPVARFRRIRASAPQRLARAHCLLHVCMWPPRVGRFGSVRFPAQSSLGAIRAQKCIPIKAK